ncbi:C2 domain-containing protein 3-like isoform X2 [Acanthaster planci]|uniref:C2 domain-containing protein 3-like isoform X2 n=1 Tax=Acanthaster planci TaxID=133434 RepID=A0A8B7Z400_ACAPL|nr:C2 domain-containing protein 3-like isoform X2 [Acanthaster planci]
MVKKKIKSTKKGRKRALKEDVHATTSLPPSVEGQLRCFLRVCISKIVWLSAKPPDATHVRLRWWGEISEGSIFRPLDVKNPQKVPTRTVARYPVRCGPKQFAAYLSDMGTLIVEVLKGPNMSSIGKAQINEIGHLAPQVPINGFYSVFSNKSADKIAELHVSLVFEPLPAAYDSSSSVPTTDLSVATGTTADSASVQSQPARTGPPRPAPKPRRVISSSSEDPFMSPIPKIPHHEKHPETHQTITPRGVDNDYSFVVGPGKTDKASGQKKDRSRTEAETGLETAISAYDSVMKGHSSDTDLSRPRDGEIHLGSTEELARREISELVSPRRHRHLDPSSQPGSDLISALLDRGTKLRDNMIRSELDRGSSAVKGGYQGQPETIHSGVPVDVVNARENRPMRRRSSGELFREILRTGDNPRPTENGFEHSITDEQTVELLFGDRISARELNDLKTLQSELSPQSSVSSESDAISETEDPLRDQSILEELFYKGVRSSGDSSLSDPLSSEEDEDDAKKHPSSKARRRRWSYESSLSDPGNQRPPSRKDKQQPSADDTPRKGQDSTPKEKSQEPVDKRHSQAVRTKDNVRLRRRTSSLSTTGSSDTDMGSTSRVSEGSRVSFQEPLIEKKVSPADGLSVQRLTLLGRIHIARVMIDSLTFWTPPPVKAADTKPSRGSRGRGRPPRPSPKPKTKKCSYFVEYHFPITASPREQSLVTNMSTEVMRLVSKKVDSKGEITFGHRSVFPIRFDGTAVDSWWKQLLVFKIFSRTAGQKSPVLLGVASLPLRSVLQSADLAVLNLDLDVKDKIYPDHSSISGPESSTAERAKDTVIGTLKMSIELASDSKDFPSALARMKVAEMRGAKIVSLPSNQPHLPIRIPTGSVDSDSKSSSRSVQTDSVSALVPDKESDDKHGPATSARGCTEGVQTSEGHSQDQPRKRQMRGEGNRLQEQPSKEWMDETLQVDLKPLDSTAKAKTQYEARTLHSLLLIPEGQAVTVHGVAPVRSSSSIPRTPPQPHSGVGAGISGLGGRDQTTRNTYLVCRLFWSDDSVRSNVCWGTTEPDYNFTQVSPVLLTPSLLERARNNCMVIEVWDKKTSAQNDQLVGIAKLPLHQFYMSFRDDRIAGTLLKSQYPVVAVDNYVNIIDPFTGVQYGQLKVLLALGSSEQISALQRLKCDKDAIDTRPLRPGHYLERGEAVTKNRAERESSQDELVEHIFEVVVEGIQCLPQLEDTVWGEADCFVRYHFPSQSPPRGPPYGTLTVPVGPVLTPHQTPTTLCTPDPTFHDVSRHRLQLPRGTPVQRELLTACAGVGGGAGGIPFEVWCRYYYPNIRDQVVAKTSLPLAKLCAMVTMQRRGEPSVQTFSLPLRLQHPDQDSLTKEQLAKLQDAGLLDVTINYRHSIVQTGGTVPRSTETGGPQVCLSVGILRACGLKSAAVSLAQFDSSLQYPSEVGVNAYVKMELSFLSKQEVRVTQTVARTFGPEFSHHVDFPCSLFLEDQESGHLSLAEALETAEMTLQVWHQVPGFKSDHDVNFVTVDGGTGKPAGISARRLFAPTGDILLATTTIPLQSLLSHRTGLQGWYPLLIPAPEWTERTSVHPPNLLSSGSLGMAGGGGQSLDRGGGGLELSVKFAHQGDRERVIDAGRRVGWSPDAELEGVEELWDDEDTAAGSYSADINVHIDSAWFPVHTALRPGQQALDTAAKAYVRYKFYDKGSVCSKLCYLDVNEESCVTADFRHGQRFHTALTQPLAWYLREERFEIQLWVSYNRELSQTDSSHSRPRQRDKLIGCAYIDMSALCDKRIRQRRISGLYPLFRPGASDLGGSCLRVHLSLKDVPSGLHYQQESSDEAEVPLQEGVGRAHSPHSRHLASAQPSRPPEHALDTEEAESRQEDERRQQEEEQRRMRRPVLMGVAVERAMHLMSVPSSNRLEAGLPSCYVTFQSAEGPPICTATVRDTAQPVWGFEQDVRISAEVLDRQSFIFKVWHQTSSEPDMNSDRMLGFASVDLAPLLAGFRSLNGWYNILDFSGHCQGQIKVSITPRESVSPLKRSPKRQTSPNTSAIFAQGFPHVPLTTLPGHHQASHSARQSPPKSTLPPSSHYQEHLQNVRKFHADLHHRLRSRQQDPTTFEQGRDSQRGVNMAPTISVDVGPSHVPTAVSNSFLMGNLRKNLEELDSVYQRLQQKLASDPPQDSPTPHENTPSVEPVKSPHIPMERILGDRGRDENSRDQVQYPTIDPLELPDESSHRRTSDDDILEKVRADLRQEDAEYISGDVDGQGAGRQNRYLETEDATSPVPESDWEDSVQFQEDREEEGSEPDGDVIVPRPLNDVSSANFSNGVRPDAVYTRGTQNQRGSELDTQRLSGDKAEDDETSLEMLRRHQFDGNDYKLGQTPDVDFVGEKQKLDLGQGSSSQFRTAIDADKVSTESNGRIGAVDERTGDSTYEIAKPDFGEDDNREEMVNVALEAVADNDGERMTDGDFANSDNQEGSPVASSKGISKSQDASDGVDSNFGQGNLVGMRPRPEFSEDVDGAQYASRQREPSNQRITADTDRDQMMSGNSDNHQRVEASLNSDCNADKCSKEVVVSQQDGSNQRRREGTEDIGGVGSPDDSDDDSMAITIDSRQTKQQTGAETRRAQPGSANHSAKLPPAQLPNFFLPPRDLEASMRALHNVTGILPRAQPRQIEDDEEPTSQPTDAARELTRRLASRHPSARSRAPRLPSKPAYKLPTAEEARRIAKIFASKFSES